MAASVLGTYIRRARGLSRYVTAITGGSGSPRQGDQPPRRAATATIAANTLRDHTVGISALSDNVARIFSRRDAAY